MARSPTASPMNLRQGIALQHPDIVGVSGIGRPDRDWSESVVAYIVALKKALREREQSHGN
jgi:acyl-CoA synthetase (AMP-forming)/AMP-acid ligase II